MKNHPSSSVESRTRDGAKTLFLSRPNCWAWTFRATCVFALGVGLANLPAHSRDVPDFLRVVAGQGKAATARAVAEQDVLVLDTSMMEIYEDALAQYKRNMRDQYPIILAGPDAAQGDQGMARPRLRRG
jgi:hypothetical protein